jgi:hypothetical protein
MIYRNATRQLPTIFLEVVRQAFQRTIINIQQPLTTDYDKRQTLVIFRGSPPDKNLQKHVHLNKINKFNKLSLESNHATKLIRQKFVLIETI